MEYPATDRTTPLRVRERARYDAPAVHAILDEAYHCAVGFVVDGEPRLLPTLHVQVGGTLYLHGSTGSRPLLAARDEPDDYALPHWAGVVPLRLTALPARPDGGVAATPPGYLSPWRTPVVLRGRTVTLEPLAPSHVDGLVAALADDEVFRWLPYRRP